MADIQIDSNKEKFIKALKKVSFRFPVAEISESTGYGKSQVSKILNDKIEVSNEFLRKFAEAYNIDLKEIDSINYKSEVKDVDKEIENLTKLLEFKDKQIVFFEQQIEFYKENCSCVKKQKTA